MTDTSKEAVERLTSPDAEIMPDGERLTMCIRTLRALLAERDALVAAAYEAAAKSVVVDGGMVYNQYLIRALTPADAQDALAARDRRMKAEGMREATALCAQAEQTTHPGDHAEAVIFHLGFTEGRKACDHAILAAAEKLESEDAD